MYLFLYLSMRLFSCLLISLALYLLMCLTPLVVVLLVQRRCNVLAEALVCVEQNFKHVNKP